MAVLPDSPLEEWRDFELWEKVEAREKKKRRLWILVTGLLFFTLSSIPIVMERSPQWKAKSLARELSVEISRMKLQVLTEHRAMRIRFLGSDTLEYAIEGVPSCQSNDVELLRVGRLGKEIDSRSTRFVDPKLAAALQLRGVVDAFCYDPVKGNEHSNEILAFVLSPQKDLIENRTDRMAVIQIQGETAEITFE